MAIIKPTPAGLDRRNQQVPFSINVDVILFGDQEYDDVLKAYKPKESICNDDGTRTIKK